MPYLPRERRLELAGGKDPLNAGDLTYLLYRELVNYLNVNGERFQAHAEILGALEACKAEWYRHRVGPYEDSKLAENGDVW